jgi:hypothetical protein
MVPALYPLRFSILYLIISVVLSKSLYPHLHCRDPDLGTGHDHLRERKFLLISGNGGGIGNYLVFYPSAFYFAALTGRVS